MNYNLLKSKIALQGRTTKDVAEALKLSKSAMYRKMHGITEFTRSEISKLIEYLDINYKEAMEIFFNEKVS